jgi:hypothetical protein
MARDANFVAVLWELGAAALGAAAGVMRPYTHSQTLIRSLRH